MKFLKPSIVIFLILTILVSCSEPETTPVLSAIHNYSSYKAIGAGVSSNDTSSRSVGNSEGKLLGQKEDGTIEVITFDDENGVEQKQTYYLSSFTATENFCFLGYSQYSSNYIDDHWFYSSYINYLLDKRNGKLYLLNKENGFSDNLNIGAEANEKVLCFTRIDNKDGLYFLSVVNNLLKVELIVDYDTIPFIGAYGSISDRLGNIGIDRYLITKNGKLKLISEEFELNTNGYFYNRSIEGPWDKTIDENGQFSPADFCPTTWLGKFNEDEYVLNTKHDDSSFYYWFYDYDWDTDTQYSTINKLTWLDEEHINYSVSCYRKFPHIYKGVYITYYFNSVGKVLYIADDLSIITFYDAINEEYQDVLSLDNVIRIKGHYKDKFGNVVITYVDNDLNTINLYIDTDGNYSTSFTPPEYIIKYLSPIN